jgi:hypothetical protein
MHDSDEVAPSGLLAEPGGVGATRRDRIIGLFGVLFYGIWMIFFGVAAVLMVAIVATGADNPGGTVLLAILCAAISVFNARRLRGPLRRLGRP